LTLKVSNVLSSLLPQRPRRKIAEDREEGDNENEMDEDDEKEEGEKVEEEEDLQPLKKKEDAPRQFSLGEFSPSPSKKASKGTADCVPLLYWTISLGDNWVVVVAESKFVKFGVEVVEDGVVVHWNATAPSSLAKALSLPEATTEIQSLEGDCKIKAPRAILEDSSLVSRVAHPDFRILKCKFKNKVKVLY
jgi:hypothetical protein